MAKMRPEQEGPQGSQLCSAGRLRAGEAVCARACMKRPDRRGVPCNFIFGLLVVVRRRIRKVQSLATVGGRWVHHASSRSAFLKL